MPMLPGVLLVAGSSADLLELDARRAIHKVLTEYPGLHLREVARHAGLEPNHAKYHLQYMEKHGLVTSRREDGYWRFWPSGAGVRRMRRGDKRLLGLLRKPVPLHVTLRLLDLEEASQATLLEHVAVAQSTLHYHLEKMERAGLVESKRRSRERMYRLVDAALVEDLLTRYRPPDKLVQGFLDAWEAWHVESGRPQEKEREKGPGMA